MMACMPTSVSCIWSEVEGETLFRPAVPIKSPIRLMSGLSILRCRRRPRGLCLRGLRSCRGGNGGKRTRLGVSGSEKELRGRHCSGDFDSRNSFSSLREERNFSGERANLFLKAFMRASSVPAEGTAFLAESEGAFCRVGNGGEKQAKRIEQRIVS